MGILFLAGNYRHLDLTKPGAFEQLMEPDFAKAEPVIRIQLSRFLKVVTEQIEDNDPAILLQNSMRRLDRSLRLDRGMQRLTQQNKIDARFCNRRVFQIAKPVFEIFERMF